MKTSLWGAMIASLSVAEGVKDRMSFVYGADEVEFNLDTSTVSVRKPYRVVFFHAGNRSLFKFNAAGQVTDIKVDLDSYKVSLPHEKEVALPHDPPFLSIGTKLLSFVIRLVSPRPNIAYIPKCPKSILHSEIVDTATPHPPQCYLEEAYCIWTLRGSLRCLHTSS